MSDDLDIDLTPGCAYADSNQPCWGPVVDQGHMARILTCTGHSQVPNGGNYYSQERAEKILRNKSRGGTLHLSYERSSASSLESNIEGIWDDRPMPEKVDDSRGFEAALLGVQPPSPRVVKPRPAPPDGEPVGVLPPVEKVKLMVRDTSDEGIPEVWKDYL